MTIDDVAGQLNIITLRLDTIILKLIHISTQVDALVEVGLSMSQVVDDLVAQVAAQKTVVDSVKTLLSQLFTLVQQGISTGDLAKAQQALDDLKAQDQALTDAVTANTPPTP